MIKTDYQNCTGCGACAKVCPRGAIQMKENEEGFLYPVVDFSKCIDCKKCEQVCQIHKDLFSKEKRQFFAGWALNDEVRAKSATAGLCASLVRYIIDRNGYVCCACYKEGKLTHQITNDYAFFDKYMRGSKYFQSEIGDAFLSVQEKLHQGYLVAFIGTPCQVAGLKLFLGKEYRNLYLIDLICHGVPSKKVFEKFAKSNQLEKILTKDISLNFRDKKTGWHSSSFVIQNEKETFYDKKIHQDPFCLAFLTDVCLRKSCYSCAFANTARVADIMIGDFWGCPQQIDTPKGVNLISANSKGLSLLKGLKTIFLKEFSRQQILQPQLEKPTEKPFIRDRFFDLLNKGDFNSLMEKLFDKKKNVALLNFHWENNNYGALLTAYALNRFINELGYYAYNIDYTPSWGENSPSYANFPEFRKKYLPMTSKCHTFKDLEKLNNYFGNFVVGSDQVFNYEFVAHNKQVYYLGFVNDENKKIAYSASFGQERFIAPPQQIVEIGYLLSRFNDIGVREKSGIEICKNVFRSRAFHVLDPVFLLSRKEWQQIAHNPEISAKKIYYIVNANLEKEIQSSLTDWTNIHHHLSVEDWLGSLSKASFVITDSFHALCFCLIFNKQFLYVGKDNGRQERVKSLFEMFDIPLTAFCLEKKITQEDIEKAPKIDYTNWKEKLAVWLDVSKDFLKSALEKENEKLYDPYYFLFQKLKTSHQIKPFKYYKYMILSKITFGKKRQKYERKYKEMQIGI